MENADGAHGFFCSSRLSLLSLSLTLACALYRSMVDASGPVSRPSARGRPSEARAMRVSLTIAKAKNKRERKCALAARVPQGEPDAGVCEWALMRVSDGPARVGGWSAGDGASVETATDAGETKE